MLTLAKRSAAQARAAVTLRVAEVAVTDSGVAVRVTDFGVGLDQQTRLQLLTYINMERVCAEGVGHFPPTAVPRAPAPPGSTAPRQGGSFPVRRGYVQPYVGGAATAVPGLIALSTSRCGMRSPLTQAGVQSSAANQALALLGGGRHRLEVLDRQQQRGHLHRPGDRPGIWRQEPDLPEEPKMTAALSRDLRGGVNEHHTTFTVRPEQWSGRCL